MPDPLEEALDRAESAARAAGLAQFELCATEAFSLSIEASDGAVRVEERGEERSLGIRVLDRGLGFSSTTDLGPRGIQGAVARAQAEARMVRAAALRGFRLPPSQPRGAAFVDARTSAEPRDGLRRLAVELEASIQSRTVVGARPITIQEARSRFWLRTSAGHEAKESGSRAAVSVHALAKKGAEAQVGSAAASGLGLADIDARGVAQRARDHAQSRLGAGALRTGRRAVVFSAEVVAELLEAMIPALLGEAVDRGTSFLARRLQVPVLGPNIDLFDEPHDPALDGATWLDGEGLPTARRILIKGGVLVGVLDDLESAARGGRAPGAQAIRGSAEHRPRAGVHGLVLGPGRRSLAALRRDAALYVTEISGAHTIQVDTGQLSLGIAGFELDPRGAAVRPFEGATVAGDLRTFFGPGAVLSAQTEVHGGIRTPALWVDSVDIAGPGT
ncbi:MAG: TldD/PmbA family protein [Myxococcota bacterium]